MSKQAKMANNRMNHRREYHGPLFLKQGFRPFFLGASLWAALSMSLWLLYLTTGEDYFQLNYFDPLDWHIHEMLYGFLPAAIAGFLLTAVPNWTGRLPVRGTPLALLAGLWLLGRLTFLLAGFMSGAEQWMIALADCLFLFVFAGLLAREIIAGKNWKNLPVIAIISALALSNVFFHLTYTTQEITFSNFQKASAALFLATILVTLIGGRIVPSFTRNWMVRNKLAPLPAPRDKIDFLGAALVSLCAFLLILAPHSLPIGLLCIGTAFVHLYRLSRWQGWRTWGEPLLLILHIGYAWVAVGFFLAGLGTLSDNITMVPAVHALGAGMMGTMILAVMTRVSRGHTGHPLEADRGTTIIYLFVSLSALIRVASALGVYPQWGYLLSGLAWIAAFSLFAILYLPLLVRH